MDNKRKALGKGLEELFGAEILDIDTLEEKIVSDTPKEEIVDIIGPLGYGTFKFEGYRNIAVLGGGIGVFPLYELAKNAAKVANVNTYLGFRNKEAVVIEEDFEKS